MILTFEKIETGEKLVFSDKFDQDYILAHFEVSPVEGQFNTTKFIDLIGENIDSTSLEPRDIYIRGLILADTYDFMKDRKKKIKAFFSPQFDIKMTYNEYYMIFRPQKTTQDDSDWRKNSNRFYFFHIYGIAYIPLWKLVKESIAQESRLKDGFRFPLIIPKDRGTTFGYMSAITPQNIPNAGDVAVGFKLRLIATYGEVTNPKISNNRTGEEIELNLTMAQGDIVEISTENGNKYVKLIRDEVETDIIDLLTLKSRMSMKILIGINDFSITASGNSSNMKSAIIYSPGWLEVV